MKRLDEVREAIGCHIPFIAASEHGRLEAILDALGSAEVLTVGDAAGFGERGVAINLESRGGRLRFEADLLAARRANLRISSKLLKLAATVR